MPLPLTRLPSRTGFASAEDSMPGRGALTVSPFCMIWFRMSVGAAVSPIETPAAPITMDEIFYQSRLRIAFNAYARVHSP